MCLRNGIFLKNTALMLASIVVIQTTVYPSALNLSTKQGSRRLSPNSPRTEVDEGDEGAVAEAAIQVVVVVALINPTHVESGIPTIELQLHLLLPLAVLENIRASGV
jgi:hypothetical protein